MAWFVYDFTNEDGSSVIGEWIRKDRISKADIGRLKEKITLLKQFGPDVGPNLLVGPIYKNIYKLRVITPERALRPLLCAGPFNTAIEFTLLLGACEVNSQLPNGAVEAADANRTILIANPNRRQRR